jgi:outer membrane protein OmpA-like peptidoglycan-associated protein/flagellar hook assembly protein FlgD
MVFMKRFLLITLIALFGSVSAGAETYHGNEINLFGNSAEPLGRAGTGVASSGAGMFHLNPASIGDLERIGVNLQYGTLPLPTRFYDGGFSLGVPTSYGVFGASFRYLNFPRSLDLKEGYSVSLGSARDITKQLLLGFSLNFFYGKNGGKSYYTGGILGFIYKFPSTGNRYGFCLFEPRIGLSVNFGYPFGGTPKNSDLNQVTLGYNFKFFSIPQFNIAFYNDFTVLNYKKFPVKIGLESEIFDIVVLRGGYVIPHAYNDGGFTAGLGVKINAEGFKGALNYAINFYPKMKYVHYFGIDVEYGRLDREPPDTEIKSDKEFISPNHDGVKDYALFKIGVHDRSRIKGWKLQIMDSNNQVVKDYSISERGIHEKLTAQEFFRKLFLKRESMVVPERIIWDGTDSKGKTVPDGKYTYTFTAWDERDNISASKSGVIVVDNVSPEVALDKGDDLFSPNGDWRKDVYVITQRIKTAPDDEWTAGFKDPSGAVVKRYVWTGNTVPFRVVWDGKDDAGANAPEGLYNYFIRGSDKAGNSAFAEIKEITLTRKYEIADIAVSTEYFSFISNASLNLFPTLSSTYGLVSWSVVIQNSKQKARKTINGTAALPKMVPYDCTDDNGERLEDGVYYVRFTASFKSGNAPESFNKSFTIDSTPPKLSVSHSPGLFSPDGDGENDLLKIISRAKDGTGIKNWQVHIIASSGDTFKTFAGSGAVPEEILWDGLGENLDIVESAADYTIVLEAADLAGNTARSDPDRLAVDVLVLVTERGLKIRISNIEFPFGSDEIKHKGKVILDRVVQILQKYENYDVLIEGHTDDIGKEEYNLELSERRAKAVNEYIISRGIRVDRLSFVGMGETIPLYPNDSDENRRRNRRVEFMLMKKGME